ncbi:MAG: tRNA (5-methylaminomethyl-2-thiouridine)(34)-methyltransferase MnmD [Methylotenera sp.]|nr:tRNA (5-methylaminomethyl-2-thiouridine)(34)-methyltransferase MnmD [Methylotenera sp.]
MRVLNNQAQIEWRDGQPYASAFDDVYFSSDDGLAETEYVFLQGNNLAERWQNLQGKTFTIAETGFGTGLNFLCAAKLWLETAPEMTVLHFISTEKYPLSLQDISKALQLWPTLSELSEALLTQYESLLLQNSNISLFNNRIKLRLLVGDANEQLPQITTQVNAWFLDGFAPSKNPEMWQSALFQQMAKLSNTETTIATFTSAGAVRRGLVEVRFAMKKRAGFGKKREMLVGRFVE